jgi:hypothetical protein
MEAAMREAPKATRTIPQKRRAEGDIQEAPPERRITWPLLRIAAQEPTKAMIHPATPMSTREGAPTKPVSRLDQALRNRIGPEVGVDAEFVNAAGPDRLTDRRPNPETTGLRLDQSVRLVAWNSRRDRRTDRPIAAPTAAPDAPGCQLGR